MPPQTGIARKSTELSNRCSYALYFSSGLLKLAAPSVQKDAVT